MNPVKESESITPQSHTVTQVTCPYCPYEWHGPDPYGKINKHVENAHPEKIEEFKLLPRDTYRKKIYTQIGLNKKMEEEKKEKKREAKNMVEQQQNEPVKQTPVQQQPPVQQQQPSQQQSPQIMVVTAEQAKAMGLSIPEPAKAVSPPVKKMEMPFEATETEEQFLTNFLLRYDLNPKFLTFQTEKFQVRGVLPQPRELLSDLNELDSGSKLKKQNDLIVWFYENALNKYMAKLQSMNLPLTSMPVGFRPGEFSNQPRDYDSQRDRQYYNPEYTRATSAPPSYSDSALQELREVKDELKRMQLEKEAAREQKIKDLEAKLEAQLQKPAQPQQDTLLAQRLENIESQNKMLTEQLNMERRKADEDRAQNLLKEIQAARDEARATAQHSLNPENAQQLFQQWYEQRQNQLNLTQDQLKQVIKEEVEKTKTGITPEQIEMVKVEKQYELDKARLEHEKESKLDIPSIVKGVGENVLPAIAEAWSRGQQARAGQPMMPQQGMPMPQQMQQPMEQRPAEMVRPCPVCGKALRFEPPPTPLIGRCDQCDASLMITPLGEVSVVKDQEAPPAEAEAPPEMKQEPEQPQVPQSEPAPPQDSSIGQLGVCAGCRRTLYSYNIAATDADGKQWCKNCRHA